MKEIVIAMRILTLILALLFCVVGIACFAIEIKKADMQLKYYGRQCIITAILMAIHLSLIHI